MDIHSKKAICSCCNLSTVQDGLQRKIEHICFMCILILQVQQIAFQCEVVITSYIILFLMMYCTKHVHIYSIHHMCMCINNFQAFFVWILKTKVTSSSQLHEVILISGGIAPHTAYFVLDNSFQAGNPPQCRHNGGLRRGCLLLTETENAAKQDLGYALRGLKVLACLRLPHKTC